MQYKKTRQEIGYLRKFTDDELIGYMVDFLDRNDQMPPHLSIAKAFSVAPNAVHERLKRLEADGILSRNEVGKFMFTRL